MRKLETEQEKIKEITEETTARVIKEIAKAEGILAAIGDGLTVLDRSFKVLYENQVVRDMMGDHVGEYCYMAYPKRQDICTGCPVALTFDDGKVHRVQRKGQAYKETRYFEITASPLKDSTGKIVAGIEVVRDITERKLTEEALRTSENKYRMLVEHSLQGILIACDSPLSFVFVNQALADIFGYTSDELMSLPPKEINSLLHPEDSSIFSQRFRDRLKGKQVPPRYEGRIIRKDGAVRWVEVYNTRIEYKGKPAVQSAFIDITDRKQTEEKLQWSEERFRALTENTSDWIWEVDQSLVFTYTSPRVKDLLGYEPNEV
ncbi:MAG: diguanylate cyclase/phosphodiesterase with sensor(s), partial [Nitrospirae bacterium]|nr:diguanylate cyclase/phosphodiesterase with sensor(s) [Nitrospirota bacterium]